MEQPRLNGILLHCALTDIANGTIGGNFYGLWSRRKEMPQPLQAIGRNRLESMARDLVEQHKIVKCLTGSSKKVKKFLDVPTGIWAVGTDLYLIENKYYKLRSEYRQIERGIQD